MANNIKIADKKPGKKINTKSIKKTGTKKIIKNTAVKQEKKNKLDLTIFVSCYNEHDLIEKTLKTVRNVLSLFKYSYEVLIYDDCSTDDSVKIIKNFIAKNKLEKQFKLRANEVNKGIGINYFNAAKEGTGEYLLIVHGDNAIPEEELKKTLNLLGKADIIVPYYETRLIKIKYNYDHRDFPRRLLSIIFTNLVRFISGYKLRYFNGLVLHKRENVLNNYVETYGLGFQAELLCKILKDPHITYLEVRQHNYAFTKIGTTAFKLKNVLSVLKSLWRIFVEHFKDY
ncbi:MAG: glycosyltransferase family 2 protein [Spirochaetes bacterium]|nr:glycosyltransferase family 2 protein [Spirochaetota bacterium]